MVSGCECACVVCVCVSCVVYFGLSILLLSLYAIRKRDKQCKTIPKWPLDLSTRPPPLLYPFASVAHLTLGTVPTGLLRLHSSAARFLEWKVAKSKKKLMHGVANKSWLYGFRFCPIIEYGSNPILAGKKLNWQKCCTNRERASEWEQQSVACLSLLFVLHQLFIINKTHTNRVATVCVTGCGLWNSHKNKAGLSLPSPSLPTYANLKANKQ